MEAELRKPHYSITIELDGKRWKLTVQAAYQNWMLVDKVATYYYYT
jgi:hypothetical protein